MKKLFFVVFTFFVLSTIIHYSVFTVRYSMTCQANASEPMLALVIDDFGGINRLGVEEMFGIKAPITCAVMPNLEFSTADANKAHALGHEVILHMPMESKSFIPRDWYGPVMINNSNTPEEAKQIFLDCLSKVPHAVGANNHIGSGISTNKELMNAIMQAAQEKGIYILDSRTNQKSICHEIAKTLSGEFLERDVFLENTSPSYNIAMERLNACIKIAKDKGYCIAIGHVGPIGSNQTAKAIADSLPLIEKEGVKIVPLSEIAKQFGRSV
jgi:hypothetical protein